MRSILILGLVLLTAGIGPTAATETDQAVAQLQILNKAFTSIAKQVTPTVVTISTKQDVEQVRRGRQFPAHPFFENPGYRRFFRDREPEERKGLGSGVIITRDGYILTNHHVAGKAKEITVILSDNREFEARLVGTDSLTDVAVIKIDAKNLPTAKIGDSDQVEIGEWVLAVGAPMDLRSTVTSGIVSALGRDINILGQSGFSVEDFIQVDAAINPGNSGGALVNLNGEVIGVNTAILTRTGNYFVGYGFAIPINLAKKIMDDITAHSYVRRGFLGVGLGNVTAGIADAFGLDRPRGVLITAVYPETPAEAAGLMAEDIILKINGQEVNRPNHVQSLIARQHPDDTVSLEIRRKNKTLTLEARLGEKPTDLRMAEAPQRKPGETRQLGLTVRDITPEIAESIGLADGDMKGIIVTDVSRGPARDAGFEPGCMIFKVRQGEIDQDIRSVKDFKTVLQRLKKGRNAAFSVRFGKNRTFLTLKIPED